MLIAHCPMLFFWHCSHFCLWLLQHEHPHTQMQWTKRRQQISNYVQEQTTPSILVQ